jgi:hyperosmotically inducible periplasmic protein
MNSTAKGLHSLLKVLCALASSASLLLNPGAGHAAPLSSQEAAKAPSDGLGSTASDAVITRQIKDRLASNISLKQSDISVSTFNGKVTLYGLASSRAAKALAEVEARRIDGVKDVDASTLTISK